MKTDYSIKFDNSHAVYSAISGLSCYFNLCETRFS